MLIRDRHVRAAIKSANAIAHTCESEYPINLSAIAEMLGVQRIEVSDMTADGCLAVDLHKELVIRYRAGQSRVRTRFTIAHEIAHLLLASAQKEDVREESFRSHGNTSAEERAVNRIASELLMPERSIRDLLSKHRPTWSSFVEIARHFDVSLMALAWRIVDTPGVPAVWLRVRYDVAGSLHHQCLASHSPQVEFDRPIRTFLDENVNRLLTEKRIRLSAYAAGSSVEFELDGRFLAKSREYWFVSWMN
jgi:Zn-dependent peptidase ImmA (M78 family)